MIKGPEPPGYTFGGSPPIGGRELSDCLASVLDSEVPEPVGLLRFNPPIVSDFPSRPIISISAP